MSQEIASIGVKAAATGIAAAFGLTAWAVAAAIIGAFASLHFEKEAPPSTVLKLLGKILSLAVLAALLASAVPHVGGFGWTESIPVAVRAGLLGVFANSAYELVRLAVKWFSGRFNTSAGG